PLAKTGRRPRRQGGARPRRARALMQWGKFYRAKAATAFKSVALCEPNPTLTSTFLAHSRD
ncbi:hypothetical protein, partial [Streptomyces mirabilis]|uniref:hypothetical protein n=1 Tax=Streptomyces mirabilis TaxID=68239 RepID=UPI0036CB50B8